jgi:ABC-type glycerol-3-phosphate transport system substrate-binding protein
MREVMIVLLTMVLVAYGAGCIAEEGSQPPAETQDMLETEEMTDKQLLELAAQEPEVGSFIAENPGYHYEITVLPPANLTELAQRYPVIYGNLPNATLYQIEYTDGRGMLVIVDLENETVVRYFRTTGVSLE